MSPGSPTIYEFGPFRLDTGQGVLLRDGQRVALLPKAVDLLSVLVCEAGRVVPKAHILEAVWGGVAVEEGNLSKLVFLLRQKLAADGGIGSAIETVPKRGYRFAAPVRLAEPDLSKIARSSPAVSSRPAIAVLPFADMSPRGDQRHVCEGISEEILNALSKLSETQVVARSSSFRFGGETVDPQAVGRQLGVSWLVEGSVRKAGQRLRITAELVDTRTGYQRWSETFDRTRADVFAIQEEIADAVIRQLTDAPLPRAPRRPPDFEAYDLYLEGRYLWNRRPGAVVWRALDCFERAVDKDPQLAAGWAGIADVYSTLGSWEAGVLPHGEAQAKARTYASRALELDPLLAEAHTTLAYTSLHYDWDLAAADAGFQRALELSPGYATAHHWRSHLFGAAGRFDESLESSRRALVYDPMNVLLQVHLAWHYHMARQPDLALEQAERVIHLDPTYHWGYYFRGLAAEALGDVPRAVNALREAVRCSERNPVMLAGLGRALALAGDELGARTIAGELGGEGTETNLFAYELALIELARGDCEEALELLECARQKRSGWLVYIGVDPRLDPLRGEPRFEGLRPSGR